MVGQSSFKLFASAFVRIFNLNSNYSIRRIRYGVGCAALAMSSFAHGAVPATERAALVALYEQTDGANWTVATNWNGAPGTECTWFGITCDSADSHVLSIALRDNHLNGTLPSLDDLPALTSFDVSTGSIAFGCGMPSDSCNHLSGPIPQLQKLPALTNFSVGGNSFSGSIPALSGLTDLQMFDVAHNALTGSMPDLSGLTNLLSFYANGNQLTGPIPSLLGLAKLQQFVVESNQLTGSVPALSGLSQLGYFDVENNRLIGSVPALVGVPDLSSFYAGNNQLTGPIPALDQVPQLQSLDLSGNHLTGPIPSLIQLATLQNFSVSSNQLTGTIPALPLSLSTFYANNNQLEGSIPFLSALNNLAVFDVGNNRLTGAIPPMTAAHLYFIDISNNQLSGALPDFKQDSALNQFFASNNQFTGTLPTLNANNWLLFDVSNNQLTGSIPDLSGLTQLQLFNVGFNQLTGPVPAPVVSTDGNSFSASSLCPNQLTHSDSEAWNAATRLSPWYRDCVSSFVNLDQAGLTGSWYSPPTSGQGFGLEIYPDLGGVGQGFLSAGWLSFGNAFQPGQVWYSVQGNVSSSHYSATVDIFAPSAPGVFDAPPVIGVDRVGVATIAFSDCTHGTLSYSFFDSSANIGTIPLTRLTPNTTCGQQGSSDDPGSSSLLSGNWYDPATGGQGLVFDIAPSSNILFGNWFTYAASDPNSVTPTFRNERWYTLQSGAFTQGSTSLSGIPIVYTTGGEFDAPTVTTSVVVGSADVAFQSCTAMTLTYHFTAGDNAGQTGTINLARLGPPPPGCHL